jgi:hypothetical protein
VRHHLPKKGFGSLVPHLWKLGTPTTDSDYQKRYNEALGLTEKGRILTEYSAAYPEMFSKSAWVKTALADIPHLAEGGHQAKRRRNKWDSYSDAKRRRTIVQANRELGVEDFCKAFDEARIGLPPGWDEKYNVTTWIDAYGIPKARRAMSRIISTDGNQN